METQRLAQVTPINKPAGAEPGSADLGACFGQLWIERQLAAGASWMESLLEAVEVSEVWKDSKWVSVKELRDGPGAEPETGGDGDGGGSFNGQPGRLKVMVVDDHPAMREAACEIIAMSAEVVGMAENGQEAVELIEEVQPDVILMDVRMPIMSGIEATKIIRATHPEIRVIAHSAYSDRALVQEMIEAGAERYVIKGSEELDTVVTTPARAAVA